MNDQVERVVDKAIAAIDGVLLSRYAASGSVTTEILLALSQQGLVLVDKNDRRWFIAAIPNVPLDDPKSFILDVMRRHKLKPGALAAKVGISASTLTRALNNPRHKFKFSMTTVEKIKKWDQDREQKTH